MTDSATVIDGVVVENEGKTLEFKRDISSPRPLLRTVVALANSAGGQILIGVDDEHRVVGVDDPLATEERLASLIADSVIPRLAPASRSSPGRANRS
jgi:ATP-dependent DNA helicase RecG